MDESEPMHFCGVMEGLAEQVAAWRKRTLVWAWQGDLPSLDDRQCREAVATAFASWAEVCGLRFVEASMSGQRVDILLTSGRIDRPGGVLAWSELPDGSDRQLTQKYDTSEAYVVAIRPGRGQIDLVAVACHEIGHAIGLEHAPQGSPDLMAPTYRSGLRTPQGGDIQRIQRLYGPATAPPPPPPDESETIVIRITGATRIEIPGYTVKRIE